MTCPACQKRPASNESTHLIIFVGMVCIECYARLNRPTRLDGCVVGESHAYICERTAAEFERRRQDLLTRARVICQEQGGHP